MFFFELIFQLSKGFVGVAFAIGSLSVWFPQFIALGYVISGKIAPCQSESCEYSDIMFRFGVITALSGLGGVAVGLYASNKLKAAGNERADAEICATGQFMLGICTAIALFVCQQNMNLTWVMGFIGLVGGCVNWALMVNMTMETCIPVRRATANAIQMFLGHALGDAISPVLVGIIADIWSTPQAISTEASYLVDFKSLQYAMLCCPLMSIMGGFFFLIAANYIVEDKKAVALVIKQGQCPSRLVDSTEMVDTSSAESDLSHTER
jgi:F0F1-type ATP synthase assembly protein I